MSSAPASANPRPALAAGLRLLVPLLVAGLFAACAPKAPAAPEVWYCPMHPTYVSDHPGTCPICNMDLVKQEPGEALPEGGEQTASPAPGHAPGHAPVVLSAEALRLSGVRTVAAERAALTRSVRTVGRVVVDSTRLHRATTKIGGWVERLAVDSEGQLVRRGQPMLSIYSPELLASQQEYLLARANAERFAASSVPEVRRGGEDLVAAARRRLELFDVPRAFLERLESSGEASRTVELAAPASGYLVAKNVVEGDRIEPGMELFTVADLSRVWIEADFYESDAAQLAVGQEARLRLPFDPSFDRTAPIAFLYPELDPQARTLRARFEIDNPGMKLRPGMFVDVVQERRLGEGIVVPDSAVLDSGVRQIVFVETQQGRFEPREVRVLGRDGGRARLADGSVAAGEKVVVKANFLLDSESRLRAALSGIEGAEAGGAAPAGHAHGNDRP